MENVLSKYGIEADLSQNQKLAALENEKLKVLRKLNSVFGKPEKEKELNIELEALEKAMEELKKTGGVLSLDDVLIESRGLTQTKVQTGRSEEEDISIKEYLLKTGEESSENKISALYDVIVYYLKRREFVKYEYWLLFGARMGYPYFMSLLYHYYKEDAYGAADDEKALYWLKKAAEFGEKDYCEELGLYYANEESDQYNPQQAAINFVKAADAEHPNSYIFAFQMFHRLGEYKKAETCLQAADQMEIQSAAHWFGMIYYNGENSTGKKDMKLVQYWYEKEYQRYPNENICADLGRVYLENGDLEKGIAVLKRGAQEFDSQTCKTYLDELDLSSL